MLLPRGHDESINPVVSQERRRLSPVCISRFPIACKKTSPSQIYLLFTIVGALVFFSGVGGLFRSNASKSWPTTQGTVVSSGVRVPKSSSKSLYTPVVRYEYHVDGHKHTSARVSFGDASTSHSSDAQKVVARYPAGSSITVHYSPKDPASSVLEAGITGANYFVPLMGFGFFGAGLWHFRGLLPALMALRAKS